MTRKTVRPTELELTILQALWDAGPSSVREITHLLNRTRRTGYTTVLKMFQIMHEKGLVARDESRRPQIYKARYTREQTQKHLLRDLADRAFGGSTRALVMQALSSKRATAEELDAIDALLDRIEGGSK